MLTISISVPSDCADPTAYMQKMMASIGYAPQRRHELVGVCDKMADAAKIMPAETGKWAAATKPGTPTNSDGAAGSPTLPVTTEDEAAFQTVHEAVDHVQKTAPQRERGKPSPGAKRRTKEEVAEDLAFEKAEEERLKAEADEQQAISTGEERVNPEDEAGDGAEDDAETQAQDAEDEAAEAEQHATAELTLDDVRQALGRYAQTYGTPATLEDGVKIFDVALGTPPDGKRWQIPMLTTPAMIRRAKAAFDEATEKNPWNRAKV